MSIKGTLALLVLGLSFPGAAALETDINVTTETTTEFDDSNDIEDIIDDSTEFEITNVDNDVDLDMTISDFKATIQNESDLYGSLNYDEVFQLMKNSLDSGENISLTDAFELSGGLTIPDNFMYDLSETGLNGKLDTSKLNYEYANLVFDMNNEFSSLNLTELSMGAVNLFDVQYGDLANEIKIEPASLPEGFSMYELTASNNAAINNLYSSAYNNGNFANIRNSIDVSGIFDKASQGVKNYQLTDIDELNNTLETLSESYKSNAEDKKNASKDKLNQQIIELANNQLDIRNYVAEYYVDVNGNLVTPDTEVDESGNAIETDVLETFHYEAMSDIADEHIIQTYCSNWSGGELDDYVDGNSSIGAQLATGYSVSLWLDAVTGNNFYDTGDDMNFMEYIATGQIGEDIYDLLH